STNTVNQVCFRRDAPTANHKDALCAMPCHFRRQLSKRVLAAMDTAWVGNDPEVLKIIGSCHGSSLNRASRGTGEGLRSRLRGKTVMSRGEGRHKGLPLPVMGGANHSLRRCLGSLARSDGPVESP